MRHIPSSYESSATSADHAGNGCTTTAVDRAAAATWLVPNLKITRKYSKHGHVACTQHGQSFPWMPRVVDIQELGSTNRSKPAVGGQGHFMRGIAVAGKKWQMFLAKAEGEASPWVPCQDKSSALSVSTFKCTWAARPCAQNYLGIVCRQL